MGYSVKADWNAEGMDGQTLLHRFRYHLGRGFVEPEDLVLDIGCGQGYGTKILSKVARKVIGIDIDTPQIKWNSDYYKKYPNVEFIDGDLEKIDLPECDIAVSFEVIEHLFDPEAFVKRLKEKVSRWIIVSVPINETMIEVNGVIQGENDSTHHSNFPTPGHLDRLFIDADWKPFFGFQNGVTYIVAYYNKNQ